MAYASPIQTSASFQGTFLSCSGSELDVPEFKSWFYEREKKMSPIVCSRVGHSSLPIAEGRAPQTVSALWFRNLLAELCHIYDSVH